MTKGGDFKRAVRREARAKGLSYTQALATVQMERKTVDERVRAWGRWRRLDGLAEHLRSTYGVGMLSVETLSEHGGGIFKVTLVDRSPAWVVRIVPPAARTPESVRGDAEILRLLDRSGFPAERCAHRNPVSFYGGQTVLVTEYVDGTARSNSPDHARRLGDALGRLHAIDIAGVRIRDGGAWGHDPACVGRPSLDIRAGHGYLDAAAGRLDAAGRFDASYLDCIGTLRAALVEADACDGLPEALTTPRTGGPNVLVASGIAVFIDWKSGGRGPRLSALAGLLSTAARAPVNHDVVDAIVDGYAPHIRLTPRELERLPAALRLQPAYYAAWGCWSASLRWHALDGTEPWWPDRDAIDAVAERALARLGRQEVWQ